VLQQIQYPNTVTSGQCYPFVASDNLLRSRQRGPHHKASQIQTLVGSGSGENAFLLAGGAEFDPVIARS
jgi:hypothetical protein